VKKGPRVGFGSNGDSRSFLEKIATAWDVAPDWVEELAQHADARGLKETGKAIGYSGSAVSGVLAGKYAGDMPRVEGAVRGALMGKTVWCQGMGLDLARNHCLEWQKKPRAPTSSGRMKMYRACRNNCPHFRQSGQSEGGLNE
jgi:hypothetical protein